jgi:TolA-binding protein
MSEEKKDEVNGQQTFLNDQAEEAQEPAGAAAEADADRASDESEAAQPAAEAPVEKPAAATEKATASKEKPAAPRKQHSPQHEEVLKRQALEQSEVKEVLVFMRKYVKPAAIVVVAVCAFILVDRFFKAQRHKKEAAADMAFLEAQGASDLQEIVDEYGSTPTGPLALMELARTKFNDGLFDEAEQLYTRFTNKYADHELAAQARLNLVTCREAKGEFSEAHLLYGKFVQEHEGSFLVPSAMLGQARCLEALDRLDEAQIAYEDIIVNYPESEWSRIAEVNLKTVLAEKQ